MVLAEPSDPRAEPTREVLRHLRRDGLFFAIIGDERIFSLQITPTLLEVGDNVAATPEFLALAGSRTELVIDPSLSHVLDTIAATPRKAITCSRPTTSRCACHGDGEDQRAQRHTASLG